MTPGYSVRMVPDQDKTDTSGNYPEFVENRRKNAEFFAVKECPLCPGFSDPCGNSNCPQLSRSDSSGVRKSGEA